MYLEKIHDTECDLEELLYVSLTECLNINIHRDLGNEEDQKQNPV